MNKFEPVRARFRCGTGGEGEWRLTGGDWGSKVHAENLAKLKLEEMRFVRCNAKLEGPMRNNIYAKVIEDIAFGDPFREVPRNLKILFN